MKLLEAEFSEMICDAWDHAGSQIKDLATMRERLERIYASDFIDPEDLSP